MDRMIPTDKAVRSRRVIRRFWRSPAMWVVLMVGFAFLFGACAGGDGAPDDVFTSMDTTEEDEVMQDFELIAFGTENYTKGERIRLSQYLGQPVVVNFWFPSCPPCRAEMPDFERTFQNHKADRVAFIGVQLLGLDTAEDGQAFVDEVGVTYALGPDEGSDITRGYDITSFPTTFFLDRNHKVVRKWVGFLTLEKMEELVQKLLKGQPSGA